MISFSSISMNPANSACVLLTCFILLNSLMTSHDVMGTICDCFSLVKQIMKYNRNTYTHTILFRSYLPRFNSDLTRLSCVRFVFASSTC
jgi:hypothetical protein